MEVLMKRIFLKLDCSKLKATFWTPRWNLDTAIAKVIEWVNAGLNIKIYDTMDNEINEFLLCKKVITGANGFVGYWLIKRIDGSIASK